MNDNNLIKHYTVVQFRINGNSKVFKWRCQSKYTSSLKSRINKLDWIDKNGISNLDFCTWTKEVENLKTKYLSFGEFCRLDNGQYHGLRIETPIR